MISKVFEEAHTKEWVETNINQMNELVLMRGIVPWEILVQRLSTFYDEKDGREGKSLRIMVGLSIIKHLRGLSDEQVVQQAKENQYIRYFCNIPDEGLENFLDPSSLCKFRQRLGKKGVQVIEEAIFNLLQQTDIISNEAALIDSSVLDSNIIYPNDVALIFNAFEKMVVFCHEYNIPLWWDQDNIKQLWHTFWLQKKKNRQQWLTGFFLLFINVLEEFKIQVDAIPVSKNPKKSKASLKRKERAEQLFNLFQLLIQQTAEKLEGKKSIDNRIVSLSEVDARPIKKGKHHPSCEFGSTVEMSFNRDGFMVTIENFIGKPDDTTLYLNTLELYAKKMNEYPNVVVTDQGYRSADNFNNTPKTVNHTFLGKSIDVEEELQDFCRKARAATEGFISVAKCHRGLGRSLYRGFNGDRIWSLFCQIAHNLKKFVQLWQEEKINEDSLVKLGLLD